jgi:hypothetical protein
MIKARSTGGTRLFGVVVGEHHPFLGDAVNVRSAIPDHAESVGAYVGLTDVVAPNDENIWLVCLGRCRHGNINGDNK